MDDALAVLMESYAKDYDFTSEEMADLRRRAAETHPELSDPQDIDRLFGKPFRG